MGWTLQNNIGGHGEGSQGRERRGGGAASAKAPRQEASGPRTPPFAIAATQALMPYACPTARAMCRPLLRDIFRTVTVRTLRQLLTLPALGFQTYPVNWSRAGSLSFSGAGSPGNHTLQEFFKVVNVLGGDSGSEARTLCVGSAAFVSHHTA